MGGSITGGRWKRTYRRQVVQLSEAGGRGTPGTGIKQNLVTGVLWGPLPPAF